MASVNKAIILGNLGQDPELRYTTGGSAVCTLSIATTDVRKDQNGERQENTEWHRVVVWNKQAENCAKYLAKGRSVYVEGRIQTRSWEDQSGQKKYSTEVIAPNSSVCRRSGRRRRESIREQLSRIVVVPEKHGLIFTTTSG